MMLTRCPRWLQADTEHWLWRGLCCVTLGMTLLKLNGMLLLAWWWIMLPIALPFLALGVLLTVILALKGLEYLSQAGG